MNVRKTTVTRTGSLRRVNIELAGNEIEAVRQILNKATDKLSKFVGMEEEINLLEHLELLFCGKKSDEISSFLSKSMPYAEQGFDNPDAVAPLHP